MILNDGALKVLQAQRLIEPPGAIQPASVDLHLGDTMRTFVPVSTIDPEINQSQWLLPIYLNSTGRFYLNRMVLALSPTKERIAVPTDHVAFLHGLSSLGRLGLMVHVTAGLIDPGNSLHITLELLSTVGPILLRPGMRIAQITYHKLTMPAERPYNGKYLGDEFEAGSRMWQEYKQEKPWQKPAPEDLSPDPMTIRHYDEAAKNKVSDLEQRLKKLPQRKRLLRLEDGPLMKE